MRLQIHRTGKPNARQRLELAAQSTYPILTGDHTILPVESFIAFFT